MSDTEKAVKHIFIGINKTTLKLDGFQVFPMANSPGPGMEHHGAPGRVCPSSTKLGLMNPIPEGKLEARVIVNYHFFLQEHGSSVSS
jgi:hypothetical protein